jgi:hypothetical protein
VLLHFAMPVFPRLTLKQLDLRDKSRPYPEHLTASTDFFKD